MNIKKIIELDISDQLKDFKSDFVHTKNEIYLNGNSLGKLPKKSIIKIKDSAENEWGKRLVRSWNEKWLDLSVRLEKKLGLLLGIKNTEIKIGDSTSIRLYQITHALLSSNLFRKNLLTDSLNFPSDNYILEGLASQFNISKTVIVQYSQNIFSDIVLLKKTIKTNPGIICLSLVSYKSSWMYPMKELNDFAKNNNSIIVWDLSHAVGVVDINLKKTNTLIAIGCTYKFLNGGPGSPGFLYIHSSLQPKLNNPIQGWFGHKVPFLFSDLYHPANNIKKFGIGTPGILSMVGMEIGLDLALKATTKLIRKKSVSQSELLLSLIRKKILSLDFKIESPLKSSERGSHITISHPESLKICKALQNGSNKFPKIITDFRPPKYIRLGISPLYTSYKDLFITVMSLHEIVKTKSYKKIKNNSHGVT